MADAIELARITAAAADTLASKLLAYNLTPHDVQDIGQAVIDSIRDAAGDVTEPNPWPVGGIVRRPGRVHPQGAIVRTAAQFGEVHTIVVRWNGSNTEVPYGPDELERVQ